MAQDRASITYERLIQTGSELIRRKGFVATRVEDVCEVSGLTKGAFFHHFKTKEDLGEACLLRWRETTLQMIKSAPFAREPNAKKRLLGCIDFFSTLFDGPTVLKSCLVGTTIQEISETHPRLRATAGVCLDGAKRQFQHLLDDALKPGVDTAALADLWMATLQGSFILYKASGNTSVIRNNMQHVKQYIAGFLPD